MPRKASKDASRFGLLFVVIAIYPRENINYGSLNQANPFASRFGLSITHITVTF
jgi:hypothetical protein